MKLRRKLPPEVQPPPAFQRGWQLTSPLLSLTGTGTDHWLVGDSCQHALVLGATGSGKTSGSVRFVADAYMRAGYGGLVMCAKPGDAAQWRDWAAQCGRAPSVITIDASGRFRLNMFDYLLHAPAERGGGLVANIVDFLLKVLDFAQGMADQGEKNDFWNQSKRELLMRAIGALYHAYGFVTLDDLFKLIVSIPNSEKQQADEGFKTWSFCYATAKRLFDNPAIPLPMREAQLIAAYFGQFMGQLDPKTRSNVLSTVSAQLSLFQTGPLHTLFCTTTNIVPEVTHEGAIVILDLPIKEFGQTGTIAQMLFKLLWQKATERRQVHANTRPVFIAADECQFFIAEYDLEFLSTARSAKAAALYATQNLPALRAKIGGRNAQDYSDAIIGYFQTLILHANTDVRTNQWAADLIGKAPVRRQSANWSQNRSSQTSSGHSTSWGRQTGESSGSNSSRGVSFSKDGSGHYSSSFQFGGGSQSGTNRSRSAGGGTNYGTSESFGDSGGGGWSEQMDYILQPSFFAHGLRTGGPANNGLVDAICVKANGTFSRTGANWTPITFRQQGG